MKKENLEELHPDFAYVLKYYREPLPKTDAAADQLRSQLMEKAQQGKSLAECIEDREHAKENGREIEGRRNFRR